MAKRLLTRVAGLVLLVAIGYAVIAGVPDLVPAAPGQLAPDRQIPALMDPVALYEVGDSPTTEGRVEAVPAHAGLLEIRVLDQDTGLPLRDALVDLTMERGKAGPKFVSDADGLVSMPRTTLVQWDIMRVDKPGYFLGALATADLSDTVLLEPNRLVLGQLINTPADLLRTHNLQIWLGYPVFTGTKLHIVFPNSQRNRDLRRNALEGDRIRIDPPFHEDAEVSLVAIPRVGIGFEVIKTVPLAKGQEWVEIDLGDVSVSEQTSSLKATISFEGTTPVGEFQFALLDDAGNPSPGGHFVTRRSAEDRQVVRLLPALKPGTYSAELRFDRGLRLFFSSIEIDGPTEITLRVGVGAAIEAIVDVALVPEVDFERFPVTVYVYGNGGKMIISSTLRSREDDSALLENLVPGEYTIWAQAENQHMISEMVTSSLRAGERSRLHFQLLPAHSLTLVSGIKREVEDLRELELRADSGAVLKLRFNLANERRTRLLHPDVYTVVCDLEDGEFRERVDLRHGDAQVVIRQ